MSLVIVDEELHPDWVAKSHLNGSISEWATLRMLILGFKFYVMHEFCDCLISIVKWEVRGDCEVGFVDVKTGKEDCCA